MARAIFFCIPKRQRLIVLHVSLVFTLGCSVTFERNDWEGYAGPGAEYFQREEFSTPQAIPERIEPVNRTIAVMNHGLIVWIVDPIARVYRFLLPRIVRTGISNFGRNLAYPKHLLNNTLQWKWKGAGNETLRFLTNTTVGVGGLFDPATSWGIEPSRENFGRTLAKWGWDPLMYLMLPLYGSGTGREIVGAVGDTFTEPQSYLFPAAQILTFNNLSGDVQTYRAFTATNYDPYELGRYIFTFTRWGRDPHYDESEYADEGETALQTLQTVLVEPQDPRFSSRARERSVNLPATGEDLRFSYWLQPEPAPVVYVLPGLGGHRKSGSSSALAEMAYGQGLSAVIISSSMNFEFMETASTVAVPGFAPADILDIHVALDAIHDELTGRYPGRITSAALMGMSLGAFHTLYIAATQERREKDLVRFDRYVAIAPPVRLLHSMETLDAFFNAPLAFPPEERQDRVENTLAKIVRLKERGLTEGQRLPFSRTEAEFIIGLAFRITLQNVIHSSQLRHDLGVLKTPVTSFRRANSYREIFEFSYMEYYYAFVLPYFIENSSQVRGPDDIIRLSDLRSLQAGLARNEKVRVFANRNDFLYAPEDLRWLARTFRDGRFHLFEDGGHLGNLHLPEVQDRIAAAFDGFAE